MIGVFIVLFQVSLSALPIAGLISSVFLWRVYRSDVSRPRSWLLFHMALGASIATFVSFLIASVAASKVFDIDMGQISGLMQVIAAFVLEILPVWYAFAVWRVRRGANPPFPSSDDRD